MKAIFRTSTSLLLSSFMIAGSVQAREDYCELALEDATVAETRRMILEGERMYLEEALLDHTGKRMLDVTTSRRVWDAVRRFWMPHYRRAKSIIAFDNSLRSSLAEVQVLDEAISIQMNQLRKTAELSTSETEVFTGFRKSLPPIQKGIHDTFLKIFGQDGAEKIPVLGNEIDLFRIHKTLKAAESSEMDTKIAEVVAEQYLKFADEVDQARKTRGQAPRTAKELSDKEIELAYSARQHAAGKNRTRDQTKLQENTRVSYTVERQKTGYRPKTVPDGKGGTKVTMESYTYYVNETVVPSYERVIFDSFDQGDRSVTGLSRIREATRQLAATESGFRTPVAALEEAVIDYLDLLDSSPKLKTAEKLQEALIQIQEAASLVRKNLPSLRTYSQWTENQVLTQWVHDSHEHFRIRNRWLIDRSIADLTLTENLVEQVARGKSAFEVTPDLPDYTIELGQLREHMVRNHIVKALIGAGAVGAGAIYFKDEIILLMAPAYQE